MVCVNDFKSELPEGDLLEAIFKRQSELIDRYHPIEEKNVGHKLPYGNIGKPFDLNDSACQLRLKDFAWRVTEEIAEATECAGQEDKTHFLEELIDALHFLVEMTIYSGITPGHLGDCVPRGWKDPNAHKLDWMFRSVKGPKGIPQWNAYKTIESLGKAMNCLKNKPWKQTHMITDKQAFFNLMIEAWRQFICLLENDAELTPETTTIFYLNKNAVNQFRIRSEY